MQYMEDQKEGSDEVSSGGDLTTSFSVLLKRLHSEVLAFRIVVPEDRLSLALFASRDRRKGKSTPIRRLGIRSWPQQVLVVFRVSQGYQ